MYVYVIVLDHWPLVLYLTFTDYPIGHQTVYSVGEQLCTFEPVFDDRYTPYWRTYHEAATWLAAVRKYTAFPDNIIVKEVFVPNE